MPMLEYLLPFLNPQNEFQSNARYVANLIGTAQVTDGIIDRLFPTKRQELEEKLLERQVKMLNANPSSEEFNSTFVNPTLKASPDVYQAIKQVMKKRPSLPTFTRMDVSNVNFDLALKSPKAPSKSILREILKVAK
jgi:hypothetical protein